MAPKKITIQATSHSTPKSLATEKQNDVNGPRSSPLMGQSRMFYQPGDKDRSADLPEADQKSSRKASLPYDRPQNGATAVVHVKRAPIPSYEEATRRNNSVINDDVSVKPRGESLSRSSEVVSRKNEKGKHHEEGEKKKPSVWYEYGEV